MIDNAATVLEELPGIAVVGMAGRFPQAADIAEFWNHLCAGRECLSRFSAAELRAAGVSPTLLDDPRYVPVNGLLAGIELFDAEFFGMTPREASITDPQQRLFLELAWHALEHSGYDPACYKGTIGIYAGCGLSTYLLHNLWSNRARMADIGDLQVLMGNNKDYLPTRVSYKLNLTGPSVNINTACSTSLVAIHFACQALLECQCDMALAGGVGIQVPQVKGYLYQEGGILSPDGHCRAFDAAARGTVSGNGAAVVVLKRLADALACGDTVYAVIRGTAVNNDGADKAGYTAPSVSGQAQVITEAQAVAGVEAETIGFIETHGTGTALGDPIEIAALNQAFRQQTARTQFCAIGSVKTNVGHLDEAAGVAGLIKTVLSLYHRQIPPSLHFQKPNPEIDFAGSPFYVNTTLRDWPAPAGGGPRRAAVSSFGIGGTNAHVVLEEAPVGRKSGCSRSWQLLLLSARNPSALNTATAHLADDLRQRGDSELADVAYTLQVGRRHFPYRKAVLCHNLIEAIQALDSGAGQLAPPPRQRPVEPSVVFLFPGQGAQHLNMGRDLYDGERLFREQVDHCAELLLPLLGYNLRALLYPEAAQAAVTRLHQTATVQPALFVIEYALARLWMSWGIHPQAMIGHSLGEYVAACLAGVLSLPDALALVVERGRLIQALPPGAMLAVALAEDELRPLLNESLALAVVNAPRRCVVAGPAAAIAALAAELSGRAIECRRLETSHAFHSPMMEPIVQPFLERVRRIRLGTPAIPYLSNVTGTWITAAEATTPDYFADHLRRAVRFSAGVDELLRTPERVFLEVGPGKSLTGIVASHPQRGPGHVLINSLRHPKEKRSDMPVLLEALSKLWVAGAVVDWQAFSADEVRHRLPLPTYPFSRQRFWIDAADTDTAAGREDASPRRRKDIRNWFHVLTWKRSPPRHAVGRPPADWLVFMDESGLGDALLYRLCAAGATIVTVNAGREFCRLDDSRYTIDSNCAQHYLDLIRQLRLHDRSSLSILHLWGVDPTGGRLHPLALHRSQRTGFYSLLWLAQALGSQNSVDAVSIRVVTSNMQSVTGTEPLCPEKATVLGPVRVIPKEYPNIRCCSIDVVFPESGSWQGSALLEVLLAELQGDGSEPVIALRGACRWVPAFDPLRLEEPRELPAALREGGVYLITGGLGSMGLAFAKYLARRAHARLALVGRTVPLTTGELTVLRERRDDRIKAKLKEIETLASEVAVFRADVSDLAAMRAVIMEILDRFGALHGIVHAAGVIGQGLIHTKTLAETEAVLAPKVAGTWVLRETLREQGIEPDFLLLCSSLSALAPIAGQVDYSAANAFLDAFAAYSSCCDGLRTISIDWGFWQELGMIEKSRMPEEFKQAIVEEIAREGWSEAGVSAFSRILAAYPSSQITVYPGDLTSCLEGAAVYTTSNDRGGPPREGVTCLESKPAEESRPEHAATAVSHPLISEHVSNSAGIETWISRFRVRDFWVLDEHRPMGSAVLPGTVYLELARAAFERCVEGAAIELRNVYFLIPMTMEDDEEREVRTILRRQEGSYEFFVVSRRRPDSDLWLEHVRGEISRVEGRPAAIDLQALEASCSAPVIVFTEPQPSAAATAFERRLRRFRPRWQCLSWVRFGLQEALARLELPPDFRDEAEAYGLHPALLDMATGFLAIYEDLEELLPFSYQRVTVWEPLPASICSRIRRRPGERPDEWQYDVTLTDTHGRILVEIAGYAFRRWRREAEQAQAGATAQSRPPAENLTVGIQTPGFLSTLTTRPAPRREPGRGEVEIEVCAAGLNFIEVLFAMGMLPAPDQLEAVRFGLECAGWIARVGEGVVEFAPGDEVIAIAPACFSAYTTVSENAVAHKPAELSLQEAATLPTVYATAYYALITQGRLRQGETVLIHSAAGGVGLAAVNIARWLGARLFATAGTPEKREFLGALGIERVLDSRSTAFADDIMQLTGGVGIDVVLNALGGEFITRSLVVLAPYGRFLELGKRDIFSGTVLPLTPFEKHLSFHALDFGLDLPDFQAVWQAVVRLLQEGVFPPLPYRLFPLERLSEAFEYMSQGRHIGKIVIAIQDRPRSVVTTAVTPPARERPLQLIIGAEPEPAGGAEKIPASGALSAVTALSNTALAAANPRPELSTPYREPTGPTEERLVLLWQELFGMASVGVDDNFFELNGDSLLAAQLVSRLYKLFEVKLAMSALFESPTVAGLAEQIERARMRNDRAAETGPITPAPPQPDYPLSHAQQRLWILAQNPAASVAYNMSYNLRLGGELNVAALRKALALLVERHEALRTAFITVKGVPRQQVRPAQPFKLPVSDLRDKGNPTAAARQWVRVEAREPFDLNQPPLLRAKLLRLSEQEQVLLVSLHHIIADGISLNVLIRELHTAYTALCADRQPALPPLAIQYRDFAVWQQQQLGGEAMQAHRTYWLEKLGGEPPLLDLPTDRTRPSLQPFSGAHVQVRLPTAAREQLQQRCQEQGVSLFILLVAALKVLLHYASGQTDILIGTPVTNREQPELANQVGYYLNTLVLRDTVRRGESFTALLQRVRTTVTEAFVHQAYPFDRLVEELAVRPPPGRSPLFEVQINLMPSEDLRLALGDLAVENFASEDETTLFDLNFMFTDGPAGLALEISYSTALFEAVTVAQLGERLMRLLAAIGEQPEATVRSLCKLFEAQGAAADKAAFLAGALDLNEEF